MKTKLTLKYSSFFFCNNVQLKKGKEVEIDTDSLSNKDVTILNAYISSGGIVSSEGLLPVVIENVDLTSQEEAPKEDTVTEKEEEVQDTVPEVVEKEAEVKEEAKEETPVAKPAVKRATRTTKKTK